MHIKPFPILFLLIICTLWFCDNSVGSEQEVNIYILADSTITLQQAVSVHLDSLKLSNVPILTLKDFISYKWTEHSFVLNNTKKKELEQWGAEYRNNGNVPFVIKVRQDRIYLGAFYHSLSSYLPQVPYIIISPFVQAIQPATNQSGTDQRNDIRIHDALRSAGILVE